MGSFFTRAARSRPAPVNIKRPPVPEHIKANVEAGKETVHQQDKELLERLKGVYVSSQTDVVTQSNPYGAERADAKLPQERRVFYGDSFDVGVVASPGHLTVPQVIEIFDRRKADKEVWPASKVADIYKLSPEDAENLLKYFNNYKITSIDKPDLTPEMKFHNLHE